MRCCKVVVFLVTFYAAYFDTGAVGDVPPLAPSLGIYRSRYGGRCERITIPLCLGMKYNMTRMPNLVGHTSQAEAAMQVHEFVPLIQFGCSRLLKFFLCSLYAPMCTVQVDEPMVIPACRSMCLEVREKCEPVMQRFHFSWPTVLDCSALPERSDRGNLCIDPPDNHEDTDPDAEYQPASVGSSGGSADSSSPFRVGQNPNWTSLLDVLRDGGRPPASAASPIANAPGGGGNRSPSAGGRPVKPAGLPPSAAASNRCPDRYVSTTLRLSGSPNETDDVTKQCAARCSVDVMFRSADKRFISTWMTVWAVLSLASSLFACFTFLIEPSRFDYPERPVIFLAVCYAFYSAAYILRAAAGAEVVSCDRPRGGLGVDQLLTASPEVDRYVIREGLESVWCLVVFLVLYYFGTAGVVWWALLAVTWFLASARKWSREAIRSYAGYIHLVGWSIPAVQTIVVLAIRRVDGDELTGTCFVGSQDSTALAGFVLAPLAIYLAVGTAFIGLGFLALFGVRHDLKRTDLGADSLHSTALSGGHGHNSATAASSADVRKLEKLMARIGLFSGLYLVAMCCHLAALFYQQLRIGESIEAALKTPCQVATSGLSELSSIQKSCQLDRSLQSVEVHALKICSPLLIGVASGLWMMSSKTIRSWSAFVCRCRQRGGRASTTTRPRTNRGHDVGRYPMIAGTLQCRSARVQAAGVGRPTVHGTSAIGGRCSKASSYSALNKGGALSLTTII